MQVYVIKHKLVMPPSHGRSIGLHVSEVIRDLAFVTGTLDSKWKTDVVIELQDTSLMQVGMAWEDYLEKSGQHPEITYHPKELKVNSGLCAICGDRFKDCLGMDHNATKLYVYMSPDGFTLDSDSDLLVALNEIKFTKKSCRDFAQGLR
jgi:hypothetical protein